jgi:Na+/H+ antiporter NhaB
MNPGCSGIFLYVGVCIMKALLTFLGLLFASVSVVFAAVPAAVTTALGDAGTDGITVAGAVLAVIVGIFAIKLMRKAL